MKKLFLLLFSLPLLGFAQTNFTYTQTCFGNQTTLVASSALVDSAIASWQWDLDGNGTYEKSGKTIMALLTVSTPVKLKITPNTGTADSTSQNVVIDPLPQPNFITTNLCETKTATYISQSAITLGSITQVKWDFNNDGADDATGDTVTYVCGPAQTYISKLTCVSDKGCSAFTQKVTTIYANPVAAFSTSGTGLCDSTKFLNTTTISSPDFFHWSFGDGNQITTSGDASHVYATYGTYSVSLIAVTQQGCRDTNAMNVTVVKQPLASFSVSNTCSGDNTVFTNTSTITAPNYYEWNFGDGNGNVSS